jgi:site-specific DNA-methyltransferase (adenine-specific)
MDTRNVTAPATDLAKQWTGWGTALKPASEHWWLVRKPLVGTVAANVERYGTGALNIDASRVVAAKGDEPLRWAQGRGMGFHGSVDNGPCEALTSEGRWPPNLLLSHTEDCAEGACADGCAVAEMDRQSGNRPGATKNSTGRSTWFAGKPTEVAVGYADSGGASRFFPVFRYQAKPSKSEKSAVNTHPTVKSIGLMDWLIRLVTPPGGVVLDPFLGSGTTGVAAAKGGFGFIGIEREDEYLAIARARIEAA